MRPLYVKGLKFLVKLGFFAIRLPLSLLRWPFRKGLTLFKGIVGYLNNTDELFGMLKSYGQARARKVFWPGFRYRTSLLELDENPTMSQYLFWLNEIAPEMEGFEVELAVLIKAGVPTDRLDMLFSGYCMIKSKQSDIHFFFSEEDLESHVELELIESDDYRVRISQMQGKVPGFGSEHNYLNPPKTSTAHAVSMIKMKPGMLWVYVELPVWSLDEDGWKAFIKNVVVPNPGFMFAVKDFPFQSDDDPSNLFCVTYYGMSFLEMFALVRNMDLFFGNPGDFGMAADTYSPSVFLIERETERPEREIPNVRWLAVQDREQLHRSLSDFLEEYRTRL